MLFEQFLERVRTFSLQIQVKCLRFPFLSVHKYSGRFEFKKYENKHFKFLYQRQHYFFRDVTISLSNDRKWTIFTAHKNVTHQFNLNYLSFFRYVFNITLHSKYAKTRSTLRFFRWKKTAYKVLFQQSKFI